MCDVSRVEVEKASVDNYPGQHSESQKGGDFGGQSLCKKSGSESVHLGACLSSNLFMEDQWLLR